MRSDGVETNRSDSRRRHQVQWRPRYVASPPQRAGGGCLSKETVNQSPPPCQGGVASRIGKRP